MNKCCSELCRPDTAPKSNKTARLLILSGLLVLGGCGNKGDLYIPQEPEDQTVAIASSLPTETNNTEHGFE